MRISDWSSDVCSSDLCGGIGRRGRLKICYPQGCGSSSLPGGTSQRPVDPCPGHLEANDMTKTARLMLFAALPLAVSGCALGPGHRPVPVAAQLACPAGAESWARTELYMGLSRPDGSLIGEADFPGLCHPEVSPPLP